MHNRDVLERFKRISRVYDLFNLIFSFGVDHYSRWKVSKYLYGNVCDLGSGKGEFSSYISKNKRVKKVIGVEISREMLNKRLKNKKIKYLISDAQNLGIKNEIFDFAVSAYLFRNIKNKNEFLKECRRILKEKGKIYILDMVKPCFPLSLIFIPYIYLFTTILSLFYPEYKFLRESILKFKPEEFVRRFNVKKRINIFGSIFYLFILEK